ncbi:MAG: YciI family protein [Cytophagales bacterium]|nr:YciI family protein [Cytophagales bacterium]
MKQYLLLFRGGDSNLAEQSPEEQQAHMQKWFAWMGGLAEKGQMVGAEPLFTTGKTVTGKDKIVSDGPFAEGKEMVGGYLICNAQSYDEAVEISKDCPVLEFEDGSVEVREIQVIEM